jgi:hypothetical protein
VWLSGLDPPENFQKEFVMPHILVVLIALATLSAWVPAQAAPMNRPQAEYSADATVENEEGTTKQKIFVTPTKERKEMLTGAGEGAVQIFRYDSKVMWTLMPSENMYMEYPIGGGPSKGSDTSQWTYEDTAMGEETLNGVRVTKYKTIATSTDGRKYGGFSWRTTDGINIKQDLLYKEGNDKKRMLTELSNLHVGRQDPKLFEIPDGFTKFDMGGMMGMMGRQGQSMGRPDTSGMPSPSTRKSGSRPEVVPPQETPAPEPEAPAESGVDKATNFMKGLFGH